MTTHSDLLAAYWASPASRDGGISFDSWLEIRGETPESNYQIELWVRGASRCQRRSAETTTEAHAIARRWVESNSTGEYYAIVVDSDGARRRWDAFDGWLKVG